MALSGGQAQSIGVKGSTAPGIAREMRTGDSFLRVTGTWTTGYWDRPPMGLPREPFEFRVVGV